MYLDSQGKKIFYDELGKPSPKTLPILLVHGWGGSSISLRPIAEILAANYRVLLVDLPGFGQSENPDPTWGVGEYAKVIGDLLKHLNISRIIYFGHSFGGSLGIYIASHEKVLQTLILCNTSYKRNTHKSMWVRIAAHLVPTQLRLLKVFIYRIFFRGSDVYRYPQLESNVRTIMKQDLTELLGKINTQTLILWGEDDKITPVSWAHELHDKISGSELKIIEGARHGLPLRQPDVVANAIRNYLSTT